MNSLYEIMLRFFDVNLLIFIYRVPDRELGSGGEMDNFR